MALFVLVCAMEITVCLTQIAIQNTDSSQIYSVQFYVQGYDGTSCGDSINNVQIWSRQQDAWIGYSEVWYDSENKGDKYHFNCGGTSGCEYTLPVSILLSTVQGNPITLTNVIQTYEAFNWIGTTCQLCNGAQTCYFPTPSPTAYPTSSPSNQPSSSPTVHPTNQPSTSPSNHPSASPSNHPSSPPSDHPSVPPTNHPSSQPSSTPTKQPVSTSSVTVSADPTATPTKQSGEVVATTASPPDSLEHIVDHKESTNSSAVADEVLAALFAVIAVLGVVACILLMIYTRKRRQKVRDDQKSEPKRGTIEIEVNRAGEPAGKPKELYKVRSVSVGIDNDENKQSAVIPDQMEAPQQLNYERKVSEPGEIDDGEQQEIQYIALHGWLQELQLTEYYQMFVEEGFGGNMSGLSSLTDFDLQQMGVSMVSHRTQILQAIEGRKASVAEQNADNGRNETITEEGSRSSRSSKSESMYARKPTYGSPTSRPSDI